MLAKINVPANAVEGLVAATTRAARGDGNVEWDSNPGASFHMSHTQARMTAYMETPAGTTVEVADGTILTVNGFGTVEVDLGQPGNTTKPVKMVFVAYMREPSRNLLSSRKAVEQGGVNRSSTTKRRLFWGSRGRSRLILTSAPARDCFRNRCETNPETKGSAGIGSKIG